MTRDDGAPALPLRFVLLLITGAVFYASYGFTGWLSQQRAPLPEVVFGWERWIPFAGWTILPYWSLNLLYAAGFFVCSTGKALWRYMQQLLAAQLVAVTCFLLFPLQITLEKPAVDGVSGRLFDLLSSFDLPYNQAPSLHVILVLIIGRHYWNFLPRILRPLWLLWCGLVVVSVLTTWQHHFIDIPGGILAGALVLWLLPDVNDCSPRFDTTLLRRPDNRKAMAIYGAGALLCFVMACRGGWWLWAAWPGVSLLLVALCYGVVGVSGFQKGKAGRHTLAVWIVLLPFFCGVRVNMALWLRGQRRCVEICDNILLGSVLCGGRFSRIVDLCAEFSPYWLPGPVAARYRSVAMLDMVVPPQEQLKRGVEAVQQLHREAPGEPLLICCALGYSRSAAVLVTWLVLHGNCNGVEEAMALIRQKRPQIVLRPTMLHLIQRVVAEAAVPAAGGGARLEGS